MGFKENLERLRAAGDIVERQKRAKEAKKKREDEERAQQRQAKRDAQETARKEAAAAKRPVRVEAVRPPASERPTVSERPRVVHAEITPRAVNWGSEIVKVAPMWEWLKNPYTGAKQITIMTEDDRAVRLNAEAVAVFTWGTVNVRVVTRTGGKFERRVPASELPAILAEYEGRKAA